MILFDGKVRPVLFCPFCGSSIVWHRKTRMYDCPRCRMRFDVSNARQRRKAPAKRNKESKP